ncbi:MAG: YebC/PmpR family DNA-binding transcriptional regulator [Candidatus Wallbacteria bacterium]|nr:YebC/PmpR family DNA-binding transcriptional regulator [Candidatus Wallbacteria bacterium]
MSGHNKWSSIKHRKGAQDAKRGKVFTKIIREITVAVRESGKELDTNSKLRTILLKAKEANMPKDTVQTAIKRGAGEIQGEIYNEITYEGYGPSGVAVLVEALTDNKNRTASEVRNTFDKHGGNLGESGCVGWMFSRKGLIIIGEGNTSEDHLMNLTVEAGAEDISHEADEFEITTASSSLDAVRKILEDAGLEIKSAEITMLPQNTIKLEGKDAEKMLKLMNSLEDNEDVQNVYANFEIDEKLIEKFAEN